MVAMVISQIHVKAEIYQLVRFSSAKLLDILDFPIVFVGLGSAPSELTRIISGLPSLDRKLHAAGR
jgi:hypothetical protein